MEGTVAARATTRFVRLPATTRVGAARASLPEDGWVVITSEDGTGIGVVSLGGFEGHDEAATLAVVARAVPPLVVVEADVPAVDAVRAPAFQAVEPGGAVLVEREGVVSGIWAGEDLVKTLVAYGIGVEKGPLIYGEIEISKIRRQCGYRQSGRYCTAVMTFPELPDQPPDCANPDGLARHRFVW